MSANDGWRYTVVTGSTGDIELTQNNQGALIQSVMFAGAAGGATTGAVLVKDGATTITTQAIGGVNTRHDLFGAIFADPKINLAVSTDRAVVIWQPA